MIGKVIFIKQKIIMISGRLRTLLYIKYKKDFNKKNYEHKSTTEPERTYDNYTHVQ